MVLKNYFKISVLYLINIITTSNLFKWIYILQISFIPILNLYLTHLWKLIQLKKLSKIITSSLSEKLILLVVFKCLHSQIKENLHHFIVMVRDEDRKILFWNIFAFVQLYLVFPSLVKKYLLFLMKRFHECIILSFILLNNEKQNSKISPVHSWCFYIIKHICVCVYIKYHTFPKVSSNVCNYHFKGC